MQTERQSGSPIAKPSPSQATTPSEFERRQIFRTTYDTTHDIPR